MNVPVTDEFRDVCSAIVSQARTDEEWAAVESDDMFQSQNYVGGFDATEMAFCFSYFDPEGTEYWFQLTSAEVSQVATGKRQYRGTADGQMNKHSRWEYDVKWTIGINCDGIRSRFFSMSRCVDSTAAPRDPLRQRLSA